MLHVMKVDLVAFIALVNKYTAQTERKHIFLGFIIVSATERITGNPADEC